MTPQSNSTAARLRLRPRWPACGRNQRRSNIAYRRFIILGCVLFGIAAQLAAQTPNPAAAVEAAELQRQQARQRALREQQETRPDVRLPSAAVANTDIPEHESPCFTISRIVFSDANPNDAAVDFSYALQSVSSGAQSVIGRCLGTAGINAVLMRIQNAIVAKGYVTTRVLAGPQDLRSGEMRLRLLPGRVRAIRFAADADPRGTQWNAVPISSGDLLNLRDIEQGLENLKRVPTAEADIQIAVTDAVDGRVGDSDLVIHYQQAALPMRINLSVDDGGSTATGKYQGSATLSYDNWLTLNDLLYISVNSDLGGGKPTQYGTNAYTIHYSIPFGYAALGFTTSRSNYYQSVAGANQSIIYSGVSQTDELQWSRVMHRDAVRKTSMVVRGILRDSRSYIEDTESEVQRRRTAAWELGLQHREFIGDNTLDLSLAYRRGTGAMKALRAPEEKCNDGAVCGTGTARFKIIYADLSFSAPFGINAPWGRQTLHYLMSARAQFNRSALTAQDQFALGGRYTVRGFDGEMSLLAERGWFVRNDLGFALGDSGQQAYLGVDYGEVGGASLSAAIGSRLAGAVLGLRGGYRGVYYDVFAGTPIIKPAYFKTASVSAGFNLSWSY